MAQERDKAIGSAMEALWASLLSVRESSGWQRKILACSYMHHRDSYPGTSVPYRQTYDSNARGFLSTFLSGFVGYLMPQDDTWAELVPMMSSYGAEADRRRWTYASIGDLDGEEGILKAAERLTAAVMAVYANTNYYPEMMMAAKDYLVMGTGYLMAVEAGKGVSYRCFDPQEVCIAEDPWRRVNVFLRRFTMDARDVVEAYPEVEWPRLSERVRANAGEYSAVRCIEAIVPSGYLYSNGERIAAESDRPFQHLMYVVDEGKLAFESGFQEFPVACMRRSRDNAKTPYGTGLCEEYLPDIIELDDMGRIRQVMRQKNADPPMAVPNSLGEDFKSYPGARNYISDMSQRPVPIQDTYNPQELLLDIQDMRDQLRANMGADLFRTVIGSTDSRKTAYEVSERKNEALTLLQMQIGTFKQEGIEPVFKRTLALLERKGIVTWQPRTVRKRDGKGRTAEAHEVGFSEFLATTRLELNSVFVRRVQAYLQYQQNVGALQALQAVSQIWPQAVLNVEENAFVRSMLYGGGMPKANMRELSDTEKRQAEWQRSMQREVDNQNLNLASGTAANLAKAEGGRGA